MLHVRRRHSWAPCVVRCIARGLLRGGGAKKSRAHAHTNFRAHPVVSRWPVSFFLLPVCLSLHQGKKNSGWVGTGGPGQPGTVGHCYTVRLRRAWLRTAAVTATTFSGARPQKIGVLVLWSLKLPLNSHSHSQISHCNATVEEHPT